MNGGMEGITMLTVNEARAILSRECPNGEACVLALPGNVLLHEVFEAIKENVEEYLKYLPQHELAYQDAKLGLLHLLKHVDCDDVDCDVETIRAAIETDWPFVGHPVPDSLARDLLQYEVPDVPKDVLHAEQARLESRVSCLEKRKAELTPKHAEYIKLAYGVELLRNEVAEIKCKKTKRCPI